jgi:hypothetical protein
MSTKCIHHLMIGMEIKFLDDLEFDDFYYKHEEMFHAKPGQLAILNDDMNDNYCFIGLLIAKEEEFEGLPLTTLSLNEIENYIETLKTEMKKLDDDIEVSEEYKLITVGRWS